MTTYQDLAADRLKRKDYIERPHGVPMIDEDSALRLSLERYRTIAYTLGETLESGER